MKRAWFDSLPQPGQKSQLCFLLWKIALKINSEGCGEQHETAQWTSFQIEVPGLCVLVHFLFRLLLSFKTWKEAAIIKFTSWVREVWCSKLQQQLLTRDRSWASVLNDFSWKETNDFFTPFFSCPIKLFYFNVTNKMKIFMDS